MKKTISCVFLSLISALLLFVGGNQIHAASNFYNAIKDYDFYRDANGNVYSDDGSLKEFDNTSSDYNYTFSFSYMLNTKAYGSDIRDMGVPITEFYGITASTEVTYTDLKGSLFNPKNDSFKVYKYNFQTLDFDIVENPGKNKEGKFTLSDLGLYKLETSIEGDGTSRFAYIIYENQFYSYELKLLDINKQYKALILELDVRAPFLITSCSDYLIKVGGNDLGKSSCGVNRQNGIYNFIVSGSIPNYMLAVTDAALNVTLNSNELDDFANVTYDIKNPEVIGSVNYYNSELIHDTFKIEYTDDVALPNHEVVSKFKIYDDSSIAKVEVNGSLCEFINDTDGYLATCVIDLINTSGNTITYLIEDANENQTTFDNTFTPTDNLLAADEDIDDYITIVEVDNKVKAEFATTSPIVRVCLFYGDDFTHEFECDSRDVISTYYYKGSIRVIILDENNNFAMKIVNSVNFKNGYTDDSIDLDYDLVELSANANIGTIATAIESLKDSACGNDAECKEKLTNSLYAKYGDLVENISEEGNVPAYIDILNKKFSDSSCAINKCDKKVEVYYSYVIGGKEQKIVLNLNYHDNLPNIIGNLQYQTSIALEYKQFDLTNQATKDKLFANNPTIGLSDSLVATVTPIFIKYTNRDGVVTELNDEAYNYIATTNQFGYYILECQVIFNNGGDLVGKNGKSFFVNVELRDTTLPDFTLQGDKEMSVKQYDVYKEPGYRCKDSSGCEVTLKYYLNDENNQVEGVDTKISGKYIIKYQAIDGDGNIVNATRVVVVEGTNTLDTTSIIIIVAVIVVFGGLLSAGIIFEIKRSKKAREQEEE